MIVPISMGGDDGHPGAELAAGVAQLAWVDSRHGRALRNATRPGVSAEDATNLSFHPSSAAAAAANPDRLRLRMRLLDTTTPSLQRTGGRLRVSNCFRNRATLPVLQDPKRKSPPTKMRRGLRVPSSAIKSPAVRPA